MIIEWDGDYWHNLASTKRKDKMKNHFLQKQGYALMRFSEHEVYQEKNKVMEIIKTLTKKLTLSLPTSTKEGTTSSVGCSM